MRTGYSDSHTKHSVASLVSRQRTQVSTVAQPHDSWEVQRTSRRLYAFNSILTMNSQRRYYYPIYVSVSEMRSPLNQRLNTFTPPTEASHLLSR